jgi:hypothetical protein
VRKDRFAIFELNALVTAEHCQMVMLVRQWKGWSAVRVLLDQVHRLGLSRTALAASRHSTQSVAEEWQLLKPVSISRSSEGQEASSAHRYL